MTKTSSAAYKANETRRRNRIAKINRELAPIVSETRQILRASGALELAARSGRSSKPTREWNPGIGRRGAIGGEPGRYIDRLEATKCSVTRSAATAARLNRERAEQLLVAAGKTSPAGSKTRRAYELITERDELETKITASLEVVEPWLAGL